MKFMAIKFISSAKYQIGCLHLMACECAISAIDLLSEHFYDPQMRCKASEGERLRSCKLDFIAGNRRVNYDSL